MNPDATSLPRYDATALTDFATELLSRAGLPGARAQIVAETLVEGDLMGHSTHGLQLLGPYLKELAAGRMTLVGQPEVISDRGAAVTWDGRYLPGPWLVHQAIDLCLDRIADHPLVTVVIRRSQHIACLATYLEKAARKGYLLLLASSDPAAKSVAPYGGSTPVYTPNPIAAGIPTAGDPLLIDVSTSTTANGRVMRTHAEGKRLAGPWLLDEAGEATDDPGAFFATPPATVLPLGGMDLGYKGFAFGLLVEALTGGLAGISREEAPDRWGASVFLQLIDPAAFGGNTAFLGANQALADACHGSTPLDPSTPVRLPGERALHLREEQKKQGIHLYPTIVPMLKKWGETFGVPFPEGESADA